MKLLNSLQFAFSNAVSGLLSKPKKVYILCYHSISNDDTIIDVKIDEFKKQIEYLSKKYDFIGLSEAVDYISGNRSPENPSIAITFDDGYSDLLTNALPILKKYNAPATIFFIAEPKQANRSELENNKKLLTPKYLKKFTDLGWEIGCHTLTHQNLIKISKKDLKNEIAVAKKMISNVLKNEVNFFAYPKGLYNQDVIDECKKARFQAAFTVDHKLIPDNCDLLKIPRISIDRTHSMWKFKLMFYPQAQFYLRIKSLNKI
ncbi:MAG: polysaccharide deacetylase family protein [Patescibacteria group bacterium]|nr:polysaccharide deacetylase family protein [Patescibacteria group bacterium]